MPAPSSQLHHTSSLPARLVLGSLHASHKAVLCQRRLDRRVDRRLHSCLGQADGLRACGICRRHGLRARRLGQLNCLGRPSLSRCLGCSRPRLRRGLGVCRLLLGLVSRRLRRRCLVDRAALLLRLRLQLFDHNGHGGGQAAHTLGHHLGGGLGAPKDEVERRPEIVRQVLQQAPQLCTVDAREDASGAGSGG